MKRLNVTTEQSRQLAYERMTRSDAELVNPWSKPGMVKQNIFFLRQTELEQLKEKLMIDRLNVRMISG